MTTKEVANRYYELM